MSGDVPSQSSRGRGGWIVLRPASDTIDYDTAPEFRAMALREIERGERKLAIDLSNVRLIDSMGLGAFVIILKRLGNEGSLHIFGASPEVQTFLSLVKMNSTLPHYENEWEATWE